MAGKFLRRAAIVDTVKSEHRTNAIQRREGLTAHPVTVTSCGCPDPACGCFHTIRTERKLPTTEEADALLVAAKSMKNALKRRNKRRSSHNDDPSG